MTLNWEGQKVTAKLRRAMVTGINRTMAAAVVHAKSNHDWENRTGTLEGSIDIVEFAQATPTGAQGTWGSRDVAYALIHELGGVIKPVKAKALSFEIDGEFVTVKQVTMPARPYLRPAGDAEYPKLAGRIRKAFDAAGSTP